MDWTESKTKRSHWWDHASGYATVTADGKRYRWRIGGPGVSRVGLCATLAEAQALAAATVDSEWPNWTPWVPA